MTGKAACAFLLTVPAMIDGVPNNTPIPPTPPELDAKPLDKVKEPKERRKGRELER